MSDNNLAGRIRPPLSERDQAECFICRRTFKSTTAYEAHRPYIDGAFRCLPPRTFDQRRA